MRYQTKQGDSPSRIARAASGWIVGRHYGTGQGDSEQNIIGVTGAALGAVIGAALGVPSDSEPQQIKAGVGQPPLRFP